MPVVPPEAGHTLRREEEEGEEFKRSSLNPRLRTELNGWSRVEPGNEATQKECGVGWFTFNKPITMSWQKWLSVELLKTVK